MTELGKLIAIEGIDGSGTTTQTAELLTRLAKRDIRVVATKEPSEGQIGKFIRELLGGKAQPHRMMAHLFCADREEHLHREIMPHLRTGTHVLCDRYTLSTLAYQTTNYSEASGVTLPPMDEGVLQWLAHLLEPTKHADLTLYIDMEPNIARRRLAERSKQEFYETSSEQARVVRNYRRIINSRLDEKLRVPQNVVVINGHFPIEQVADRLEAAILNFLWNNV